MSIGVELRWRHAWQTFERQAHERRGGTRARQVQGDAGFEFHDAGGDLDEAQAQGVELGALVCPMETAAWRSVSWRRGAKKRLSALFAALRVRVADAPTQRIGAMGGQHLPGEEVWLVGERRSTGERKHYLSNLPADTPLKRLAGAIKARWVCEQAHQQLKEELGLDHFEGRSWHGLHRHALMTMIAFAFLQSRRLAQASWEKKNLRTTASAEPPGRAGGHHRRARDATADAMSPLP
jgi:SRSO17 transposase